MYITTAFIHLDLGLGGAENLVVNAAKGLQDCGHKVTIYTSRHDPKRAFKETVDARSQLIFYCHYPDLLLCTNRSSSVKRFYRKPFDWIEKTTTSMCDVLLVNSEFTARTVRRTFPNIQCKIEVLYPAVNVEECTGSHGIIDQFDPTQDTGTRDLFKLSLDNSNETPSFFLSLNRYERKKDIALVLESFTAFQNFAGQRKPKSTNTFLVVAGGYDTSVVENVEYYAELVELAGNLGIYEKVIFLKNISESARRWLMTNALGVVYSPQNEHFGIVPCESMVLGTAVVAWNNGGPTESIVHRKTGFLCNATTEFSDAMVLLAGMSRVEREELQTNCKKRINELFSLTEFSRKLNRLATQCGE